MSDVNTAPPYVPEGFSKATNTLELLTMARVILQQRGRWIKHNMFWNEHPEEDPTTPFCNIWRVCAVGALAVVIWPMTKEDDCWQFLDLDNLHSSEPEIINNVYQEAINALGEVTNDLFDCPSVFDFNDSETTTLEQVLEVYDQAIQNQTRKQEGDTYDH